MIWQQCSLKASLLRRIREQEGNTIRNLGRLVIQLAIMASRFLYKNYLINYGEAPSLAVFRSKFVTNYRAYRSVECLDEAQWKYRNRNTIGVYKLSLIYCSC